MRLKGSLSLTVEEVAKAKNFAALGYSCRHIARELQRSPHTVARLLKMPTVAAEVSTQKMELADLYEKLCRDTLESITTETIQDASLQQRAVSAGIFTDKSRLLRGESTSNVDVHLLLDIATMLRDEEQRESEATWQRQHALLASKTTP
jgi:hypothetical protein